MNSLSIAFFAMFVTCVSIYGQIGNNDAKHSFSSVRNTENVLNHANSGAFSGGMTGGTNSISSEVFRNSSDHFQDALLSENYENHSRKKYSGFYLSSGYGNSYGGIGIRAQYRWGDLLGFGVHAGAGYFFGLASSSSKLETVGAVLFSAGAKFYFIKGWYVNAQYGAFGYGKYEEQVTYYNYSSWSGGHYYYDYKNEEGYLVGPSFLVGADLIFGEHFGLNFGLGASLNTVHTEYFGEWYPALDLGFNVKF